MLETTADIITEIITASAIKITGTDPG